MFRDVSYKGGVKMDVTKCLWNIDLKWIERFLWNIDLKWVGKCTQILTICVAGVR